MKKMMLFKAAILCVVMMAFGLSLTACGDDETVTEDPLCGYDGFWLVVDRLWG